MMCRLTLKPCGLGVGVLAGRVFGHFDIGGGRSGRGIAGLATTGVGHCEGPFHFGYDILLEAALVVDIALNRPVALRIDNRKVEKREDSSEVVPPVTQY